MRAIRILGLVLSVSMVVGAIVGFVLSGKRGEPTTNTFDCDRASRTCKTSYPALQQTIALGDITGVELATTKVGLGRGARVETQSYVLLKRTTGDIAITPSTAEGASVQSFTNEVSQIQAFLSGTDPNLSVRSTSRSSAAESSNNAGSGILALALGVVLFVLLIRWKPKQPLAHTPL